MDEESRDGFASMLIDLNKNKGRNFCGAGFLASLRLKNIINRNFRVFVQRSNRSTSFCTERVKEKRDFGELGFLPREGGGENKRGFEKEKVS